MDKKVVDVTIGIVTYNRVEVLKRCLNSIVNSSVRPTKIIIVDNGQDKAEKIIPNYSFLPIEYISIEERVPMTFSRNRALERTDTSIIAFIDDDTEVSIDWLKNLSNVYRDCDRQKIAGVTGPAINCNKNGDPLEKIIRSNKNLNFFTKWGDARYQGKRWIPQKQAFCDFMIGCNMSFFTDLIKAAGGFDEELFNPSFREDTDASAKLFKIGYKFIYNPGVYLKHFPNTDGGITDVERTNNYFYLAGKNHRRFVDKYFSKFLTRASWVFWSKNPPSLIFSLFLSFFRKKNYFYWHKGLWEDAFSFINNNNNNNNNYFSSSDYERIIGEENYENNNSNLIYLKAINFLDFDENDIYLDIGCGYGDLASLARKKCLSVFGVDYLSSRIEIAKKRNDNCDFKIADALELPFNNCSFNKISCLGVLGYFNGVSLDKFLSEINRVSKNNARIVIRVGKFSNIFYLFFLKFFKGEKSKVYVANNFSKIFLKKLFLKHGFESRFYLSREYNGTRLKNLLFFIISFVAAPYWIVLTKK